MDSTSDERSPESIGAFSISKVVSLSHTVSAEMPRWPDDPPTEFQPWSDIERDGHFLRRFSMGEHSGTHIAAPASFYRTGNTIDRYSAVDLVRPAVVIDVRSQSSSNSDYALTVGDLLTWEANHGKVTAGCLVLLLTGWAERWDDPRSYLGRDPAGNLHFPGFGRDAANFLINERGAAGMGTDTAGVEPGIDGSLSVSRLVLAQPRIVLENLTNLDLLPATGAMLVIGVLRLVGGSGSPAAVTALLPLGKT